MNITYYKYKLVYISVVLVLSGCFNKPNITNVEEINLPAIEKNVKLTKVFCDSIVVTKLESSDDILVSNIFKCHVTESVIYILDSHQTLFKFKRNGEFITKRRKKGKGAGEWISPIDFTVLQDKIVVWDFTLAKLIFLNLNLELIKEERLNFTCHSICNDGSTLLAYRAAKNNSSELLWLDEKCDILHHALPAKNIEGCRAQKMPFTYSKDKLYFHTNRSNVIYGIDSLIVKPEYLIDFGKYEIPDESFYKKQHENILNRIYKSDRHIWGYLFHEFNNSIFISYIVNSKQYFYIRNNRSKSMHVSDFIDDIGINQHGDILSYLNIVGFIDDYIIFSYSKEVENDNVKNPILHDKLKDVKSNDNPVLVFVKFT